MRQLYVHLYMKHLGSLKSTQEARVALGYASSYSYASFLLSKLSACFISQKSHVIVLLTWAAHMFNETEYRLLFADELETSI